MFRPRMTPTADGKGLLMTYEKGVYGFHCTSANDCHWTKKNYELQISREQHLFLTVPSSLVEDCYCPLRHIPDYDQNNCQACNPDQIVIGVECETCPTGQVPDTDKNICKACNPEEITTTGKCEACPPEKVPDPTRKTCTICNLDDRTNTGKCCPNGQVPNTNKTACKVCRSEEITKAGKCEACPTDQVPDTDKKTCIEGIYIIHNYYTYH